MVEVSDWWIFLAKDGRYVAVEANNADEALAGLRQFRIINAEYVRTQSSMPTGCDLFIKKP